MEGAAHHHVGQHVEAAGQVELLEDHGAAGAPLRAARGRVSAVTSVSPKQDAARLSDRPAG